MESTTEGSKSEESTVTLTRTQLVKLCGENWPHNLGASALSQASDEFSLLSDVLSEAGNNTAAVCAQRAAERYDLIARIIANLDADWSEPEDDDGTEGSDNG